MPEAALLYFMHETRHSRQFHMFILHQYWLTGEGRIDYLSPALALRCVELQTQEPGPDHTEPVDVDHVGGVVALVTEDTVDHK